MSCEMAGGAEHGAELGAPQTQHAAKLPTARVLQHRGGQVKA